MLNTVDTTVFRTNAFLNRFLKQEYRSIHGMVCLSVILTILVYMNESGKNFLEHECAYIPKTGVVVIFDSELHHPEKSWRMYIFREATEADLEKSHIFENEGDLVWSTSINISHCPFCGGDLYKISDLSIQSDHRFVHCDHTNWKVKVM